MKTKEETNSDLSFRELFSEIVFKLQSESKTDFTEPKLTLKDYPDLGKHNIESRDFKSPYINKDDEVGGNLYKWIRQSYSVLWESDKIKNEIILYRKTNEKSGLRFATLLKMDKEVAKTGVMAMSAVLALSELLWEKSPPAGDLTKAGHKKMKKEFIFNCAHKTLFDNLDTMKILNKFMMMFETQTKC